MPANAVVEVPVLCKFWRDAEVWNASAVDLPVAVFGSTFEQAQDHMSDAIVAHLRALQRLGELQPIVQYLRTAARDRSVRVDDMAINQPLLRISAAIQDQQVVAVI